MVHQIGRLDIGQAAIVQNGFVIGVEAAEGTDRLVGRCADFVSQELPAASGQSRRRPPGRRIDLPAVGLSAVDIVRAGLRYCSRDRPGTYYRPTEGDPRSRCGGHFPVRRITEKLTVPRCRAKEVPLIWLIAGEPSGDQLTLT